MRNRIKYERITAGGVVLRPASTKKSHLKRLSVYKKRRSEFIEYNKEIISERIRKERITPNNLRLIMHNFKELQYKPPRKRNLKFNISRLEQEIILY